MIVQDTIALLVVLFALSIIPVDLFQQVQYIQFFPSRGFL